MQLRDFYFKDKAVVGTHMAIPQPDGSDSGEWLNVMLPAADEVEQANRAFFAAYQAVIKELEPLKESGDQVSYAIQVNDACARLNDEMALEIVNGWSFIDAETGEAEPFTKEALATLLSQYKGLGNMVAAFMATLRESQKEK